ncbi:MAG: adenylate cyclase, partial [Alphaproteobacteria bacterium]|nr:adenylate cyclase [Alphaproteobacteria bacterium]
MLDVARWLAELGLGRYAECFSRNDIRADVLPDLTDADLRDLGIESLGDRKRLLRAIAALADAPRPTAEPRADDPGAERRQLSILFVDLVDSSRLSAQLDPEEMAGVIRGYQDAVAGVVARLGGHVAKFMGDGVLAYFGWPAAREDAAERAVR